jgi:hypothetical protein
MVESQHSCDATGHSITEAYEVSKDEYSIKITRKDMPKFCLRIAAPISHELLVTDLKPESVPAGEVATLMAALLTPHAQEIDKLFLSDIAASGNNGHRLRQERVFIRNVLNCLGSTWATSFTIEITTTLGNKHNLSASRNRKS